MAQWVRAGKLSYREEIIEGLEQAPSAFIGLFKGESFGRRLVHVGG
jgi:NADPH-dependent curcumin reductase CurA